MGDDAIWVGEEGREEREEMRAGACRNLFVVLLSGKCMRTRRTMEEANTSARGHLCRRHDDELLTAEKGQSGRDKIVKTDSNEAEGFETTKRRADLPSS